MNFHRIKIIVPKPMTNFKLRLFFIFAALMITACQDAVQQNQAVLFSVSLDIEGPGTINDVARIIDCELPCTTRVEVGTELVFEAQPNPGARFLGWTGPCNASSKSCRFSVSEDVTVRASFRKLGTLLRTEVEGGGVVTSEPEGIDCGKACEYDFSEGTTVTLTAVADPGHNFSVWTGCTNVPTSTPVIEVPIEKNPISCKASFVITSRSLEVTRPRGGRVRSQPGDIDCARSGGVCRSSFNYGTPLQLLAEASPGHRFIAWDNGCTGTSTTCDLVMDDNKTVTAQFQADALNLSVSVTGGLGKVVSQPTGIDCDENSTGACSYDYPFGTELTLEAIARPDYEFIRWRGAPSCDRLPSCALTVTSTLNVIAEFAEFRWDLSITKIGNGRIQSNPSGIDCGNNCFASYRPDVLVTLSAEPDQYSYFSGWVDNQCVGTEDCVINMDQDRTVVARFEPIQHSLDVAVTEGGRVTSSPSGIDCGTDCSEVFNAGTVIELLAEPEPLFELTQWQGENCVNQNVCSFTLTGTRTISAEFALICASTSSVPAACDGNCVDLSNDILHCGSCGKECPAGAVCTNGECRCPGANAVICDGQCVDLDRDLNHCGVCGKTCPVSSICNSGECRCAASGDECAWNCLNSGCDDPIDVVAGRAHSCARTQNGSVYCWGDNRFGQLGLGNTRNQNEPTRVEGLSNVTALATGAYFTCASRTDGSIYCWGDNTYQQIGTSTNAFAVSPVQVASFVGLSDMAAGDAHMCVVLSNGTVECWGWNAFGQLGVAGNQNSGSPNLVTNLGPANQISAGQAHTCARMNQGLVNCWGANDRGQLGNGSNISNSQPTIVIGAVNIDEVASGSNHNCARQSSGQVICWGDNREQQLGDGTTVTRYVRTLANLTTEAVSLSMGQDHSCAVTSNQEVVCWGNNTYGQLGTAQTNARVHAVSVNATDLDLGHNHTCVVDDSNNVQCWGANEDGQIGEGTNEFDIIPNQYRYVENLENITQVVQGQTHVCALQSSGLVFCWGQNLYGELGRGNYLDSLTPVQVVDITDAVEIAAGLYHTCARRSSGEVMCWGWNFYGQVGDGTNFAKPRPTSVPGISDARELALGAEFSCVVRQSSDILCWGRNSDGQLGNGNNTNQLTPDSVTNLSSVTSLSAGGYHACAVLNNGTVQCWGRNDAGQLGDGSTTSRNIANGVVGLASATSMTAGTRHSCAVLNNGTVQCWGANGFGQLGDQTLTQKRTPVEISTSNTIQQLSAGDVHTCALGTNGQAECWGNNSDGQLGDGTLTQRTMPTLVAGLVDSVNLSAGATSSCSVLLSGQILCWGNNAYGQLGDGTTNSRNSAVFTQIIEGRSSPTFALPPAICAGQRIDFTNDPQNCGACDQRCAQNATCVASQCQCSDGSRCAWKCLSSGGCDDPVQLSSGLRYTCALRGQGEIYCWGTNNFGQLGNGTVTNALTPTAVNGISSAEQVSAGTSHACARLQTGVVQCWGINTSGQLGTGNFASQIRPQTVSGISGVIDVAAGGKHSCAVIQSGDVYCWGANDWGQLGNGTLVGTTLPSLVTGLSDVIQISLGDEHSCARTQRDEVYCWGQNDRGQLGNGSFNFRAFPAYVRQDAADIRLGDRHSCLLSNFGSMDCWGANNFGELGISSTIDQPSPITVLGLSDLAQIDAGGSQTCATNNDGEVYCWGDNQLGQAGNGSVGASVLAPSKVSAGTLVRTTAVGGEHVCSLADSGQIICWGDNAFGSLGNGSVRSRTYPGEVSAP
ncbi:MAG: hypothetical protein VYC39_05445 [Myxococcota bacterium]|nr:hypothetical protein [Myxococcota bacterium]